MTTQEKSPYSPCRSLLLSILGCLISFAAVEAAEAPLPLYIYADYLERRPAENALRFQGSVEVKYGDSRIFADTIDINTETGDGTAVGHVRFEDPQQQISAERAEFNIFSRLGSLYQASGSFKGQSPIHRQGEVRQPVTFFVTAERFDRETPERTHTRQGSFTTCIGPDPVWQFKSRQATVETEGYAHLSHATFWIKSVPVFYTPYFLFPTKTERATGILPPRFGTSDELGVFLDNQFFWAINEQSDSTIGVGYLSKRGIRPNLEYRYALSERDRGQFNALYLDDDLTGSKFWKISGTSEQHLPGQVRGILALDLMSRANYDRTFEVENLLARTRRETDTYMSFSRNWQDVGIGVHAQRLEDAENSADERLTRYPDLSFDLLPTPLPWSPVIASLGALATSFRFDRTEAQGGDADARRLNILPQLAWTYTQRPWLAITPFFGLQETVLDPANQGSELQSVAQLGAELRGPQLFRIFGDEGGTQLKHLLEPSITYHWIPHFQEKTRRQPFDILDDVFPRNDFMFSLTNRLYAKTTDARGALETREFALLRISQGLDLRGKRGEEFTQLAPGPFFADLSLEARAQVTSTLTLRADVAYDYQEGQLDIANTGIALEPLPLWTLFVERRFRRDPDIDFVNGGVAFTLPKGWSLTYTTGYNARDNVFGGNAFLALYRAQCWSVSLQIVQRPDDTSVAFQVGLDSFFLPKVGF